MKIIHLFTAIIVLTILSCSPKLEDGIYAKVNTNKGEIQLQLTYDQTPVTVANFVSLAEGTNTQVDSIYSGKPYYDGLIFHRVIQDFMIQGGDPLARNASDKAALEAKIAKKAAQKKAEEGAAKNVTTKVVRKKGIKKDDAGLDDLLNAGLNPKKKK